MNPDTASKLAEEHGLNPEGYPVVPTGLVTRSSPVEIPDDYESDFVPWSTSASKVMSSGYECEDDSYSLLEWLVDYAGGQGMELTEFLGNIGIGPEAEEDKLNEEDDLCR